MNQQPETVSFDQMVTNLFKANSHEFNAEAAPLMHAAVGIMGEAIEFAFSTDTANAHEEAGDLEFYIEAFFQQVKFSELDIQILSDSRLTILQNLADVGDVPDALDSIIKHSANLLDLVKKTWAYHKPMTELRAAMAIECGCLAGAALAVYSMIGFNHPDILRANQEKLAKRYPDGVYSNLHAQQRLDKTDISEGGNCD